MIKSPRTTRLLHRIGRSDVRLRLSQADRHFLGDLARVHILSDALADQHHYNDGRQRRARDRLAVLVDAGLLTRQTIYDRQLRPHTVYQFANAKVAKAFGGHYQRNNINRSDYHELLTAQAYFALGCPDSFRVAGQFSEQDYLTAGDMHRAALPDAMFENDDGHCVFVEADSGHYTTRQIRDKQRAWGQRSQVWIQPQRAHARVKTQAHVNVITV